MVQLLILSGKLAGTRWVARRFPVRIGRATTNDLCLEENGIWDEHLQLDFDRHEGFTLTTCANALLTVNREPVQTARLRNGDSLEIGSVRIQFSLREAQQQALRCSEWLVWTLVAIVSLGQIALIYWLLQ